jgi:hypothetical protein
MSIANDEPTHEDALGHHALARRVGHRILKCNPPYVVGVCGSWGSGKTSFLRKVWAYLGGDFEPQDATDRQRELKDRWRKQWLDKKREEWFAEQRIGEFDQLLKHKDGKTERQLELVWFNPWQHQFEASPLIALLNEIRQHFAFKQQLVDAAGKFANVAAHAIFNSLGEAAKLINVSLPSSKTILEPKKEYEASHFSTQLTSQRFRDFFEEAIASVTDNKGLLVIFIDDLDRCEGDVAYRLLESLKLYLNAKNCVYILGLDQQHLENSIAKALSGEKETWRYRPMARDYLSKIFQNLFVLPVPRKTEEYIETVLVKTDKDFQRRLRDLFAFKAEDWAQLVTTLDAVLPHNPRKIKSFISSWKLLLDLLPPHADGLDWRLTLILHYLAQFEEPLFRKVEEAPAFYNDHILRFCAQGVKNHFLLDDGLELPYESAATATDTTPTTGGYDTTPAPVAVSEEQKPKSQYAPGQRIFWIKSLVEKLGYQEEDRILRHLLHTGEVKK